MSNSHPHKILLVEDEAILSMAEARTIQSFGYEIAIAYNGVTAIEIALQDDRIDLILMDINLGNGIDGTEVARQILQKRNVPIVFLTSHAEREMVEKVRNITRYGYVIKNSGSFVLQSSIEMAFELFAAHEVSKANEIRWQFALEGSGEGVWDWNLVENTVFYSSQCRVMLGYEESEPWDSATEWTQRVHTDDQSRVYNRLASHLRGETPSYQEEYRICCKDGSYIWVLDRGKIVQWTGDGRPVRMIGTATDITERKNFETALEDRDARLREAQRISHTGSYEYDHNTHRAWWSDELINILGVSPGEINSNVDSVLLFVHPDDQEWVAARMAKQEPIDCESEFELRILRPDGTKRVVNIFNSNLFDSDGRLVRSIGTAQDVTDRVRAEERIRHLNRVYAVLSNINQAIVRIREPQTLYEQACRIAVEDGGFKMAWIGLLDQRSRRISPVAQTGLSDNFLKDFDAVMMSGLGKYFQSLQGSHFVCNDVRKDARVAGLWETAQKYGFRSFAVFMLEVAGQVQGTVNLFSGETDFFNEVELKLLDELTSDISFALDYFNQDTERRRVEKALRESEARFRKIFEKSPVGIELYDESGRMVDANPACLEIFGVDSVEEMLGFQFFHDPHVDEEYKKQLRLGVTVRDQMLYDFDRVNALNIYRTKNQGIKLLEILITPLEDDSKVFSGYLAQIQEISDREEVDLEARLSQYRMSVSMDLAKMVYWEYDVLSNLFQFNDQFYALYETTAEQEGGYQMSPPEYATRFLPPEEAHIVMDEVAQAIATADPAFTRRLQHRIRRADGEERHISVCFRVVKDAQNRTIRTYGANQDITEYKRTQQQIQNLLSEKEILLREVHHRIKNNMGSIASLLILQADSAEPAAAAVLQDAYSRVLSTMKIYDKLYQSQDLQHISLRAFLLDLVTEIMHTYLNPGWNVNLVEEIQDISIETRLSFPIGMIVNELITNACKYAFPYPMAAEIGVLVHSLENGGFRLSVWDSGIGLPDTVNLEQPESFGFILVKTLVQQIDGDLNVVRARGTRFDLTVPQRP